MDRTHRPTLLSTVLLTCAIALVPAGPASAAACANATLVPDGSNIVQVRAATRCLINRERARFGRRPLAASAALNVPAQSHSRQMVEESFFDHVSPAGSSVVTRVKRLSNYINKRTARYAVGENLAWGSGDLATPAEIVKSWMHSPGHRRNILERRYRDIGIGVVSGAPQDVRGGRAGTYTTVFGQRSRR